MPGVIPALSRPERSRPVAGLAGGGSCGYGRGAQPGQARAPDGGTAHLWELQLDAEHRLRNHVSTYCPVDPGAVCALVLRGGLLRRVVAYAAGLESYTLPLLCCIDPANPGGYLDRTTGIQDPEAFYARLGAWGGGSATSTVQIQRCLVINGRITLALTNLVSGKNTRVERSLDLKTWMPIAEFASSSAGTTWSGPLQSGESKAFYRVSVGD